MNQRADVIALANRLLDVPNADPDDDVRTLARQFLREVEICDSFRVENAAIRASVVDWRAAMASAEAASSPLAEDFPLDIYLQLHEG